MLRTNLGLNGGPASLQTLLVAAAGAGEGASDVAIRLARATAEAGARVVLADADLRRPGLHLRFGAGNERGLADVLASEPLPAELPLVATGVPGLRLLPAGPVPENPAMLLGAGRLRTLLDRLLDTADVVLVDVPPLVAVADGAQIAAHVDGVLLVASAGRTRRDQLARARGLLDNVGATVVGVALIGGDGEVTPGGY